MCSAIRPCRAPYRSMHVYGLPPLCRSRGLIIKAGSSSSALLESTASWRIYYGAERWRRRCGSVLVSDSVDFAPVGVHFSLVVLYSASNSLCIAVHLKMWPMGGFRISLPCHMSKARTPRSASCPSYPSLSLAPPRSCRRAVVAIQNQHLSLQCLGTRVRNRPMVRRLCRIDDMSVLMPASATETDGKSNWSSARELEQGSTGRRGT